MNRKFWRLISALCFLIGFGLAYPRQANAGPVLQDLPNLAALLEVTTDGVEMLPNGTTQWIAVSGRSAVSGGDSIRTNNTGSAFLIWFEDGTLVEVESNTWLYINEFKGTGSNGIFSIDITLVVGRMFNSVKSLVDPNSRYTINTPTMQISVRGTNFGVDVSSSLDTTLAVTDGVIAGTQGKPASVLFEVNAGYWVRSKLQEPFGNSLTFAEAGNDPVVLALIAGGQNLQSGSTPLSTPEPADDTPRPAATTEPVGGTGPAFTPEASNDNTNDDHGGGDDDNSNDDNGGDSNDNDDDD